MASDFQEKLEKVIEEILPDPNSDYNYGLLPDEEGFNSDTEQSHWLLAERRKEAQATILSLVDTVIGEDEHFSPDDHLREVSPEPFQWAERNQLRFELRQKLGIKEGEK